MRMHMRRFARLTNAFSKKIENHCHAIALHFVYYNFVKATQNIARYSRNGCGLNQAIYEYRRYRRANRRILKGSEKLF